MSDKLLTAIAVLFVSSWACVAHAGTMTEYTDRPTFDLAVGPTTVEDFLPEAHFPIPSGILNDQTNEAGIVPGDIVSGVTFSTPIGSGNFFNIDAGGGFTGGMLDRIGSLEDLTITFDQPHSAFGFDTNSLMGSEFSWEIHFAGGGSAIGTSAVADSEAMQFYGFQSSETDIVMITIRGNSPTFAFIIDNFSFDTGVGIPVSEPIPTLSNIALVLMAIFLLGLGFRKTGWTA